MSNVIPQFQKFYPCLDDLDAGQRSFYDGLKNRLEHGEFPDVDGNISYLFLYIYTILDLARNPRLVGEARKSAFLSLYNQLFEIAEAYQERESKVAFYCAGWAPDCLLITGQYEKYLEVTEPSKVFCCNTHGSNTRLNVQFHLGHPGNALDLYHLAFRSARPISREHSGIFIEALHRAFDDHAARNGPWLDRILALEGESPATYKHYLFPGCAGELTSSGLAYHCFYDKITMLLEIQSVAKVAENMVRDALKIPGIVENWKAKTEIFDLIRTRFPETQVVQARRPSWLAPQYLDVWLPRWNIAIQYGDCHHFGPMDSSSALEGQLRPDELNAWKIELCRKNGVELIVVPPETPSELVVDSVRNARIR